eukprot:PITA_33517
MPSRHKFQLVKVEEEEDHMLEEEEEAHIEVEEADLQAQVEGETIKIQVKAQAKNKHKVRANDDFLIADFKEVMKNEFEMTDLGLLRYFLAIGVKKSKNGIFISQEKYVADILERFFMQNSKPPSIPPIMGLKLSKEDCSNNVNLTLYKCMIASLMYLTTTRPDIMYAVNLVSRFMETRKETLWQAGKRILRYVNGTKQHGILYTATNDFRLVGYTDSD